MVALDRCGNHSRSKRCRSNVLPKYVPARRFFARLASEIFLTSLQAAFFNKMLVWDESHLAPFYSMPSVEIFELQVKHISPPEKR